METQTTRAEEKETSRIEAFSDGVFAIAITLLALNLNVPHIGSNTGVWALAHELGRQWPSYVAFFTSFFTVLVMWINHHGIFKLIYKANVRLLFANGFLLMMTTAVPFSTGLLSEYFNTPSAKMACAVYAGTFVLISFGYSFVWYAISHERALLKSSVPDETVQKIAKNFSFGPPLYIAATISAFFSVYLSVGICIALWIFWAVTMKDP